MGLYITEALDELMQSKGIPSLTTNMHEHEESGDLEDEERALDLISQIKASETLLNERRKIAEYKLSTISKTYELNIQKSEKQAQLERLQVDLHRIKHAYEIEKRGEKNDMVVTKEFVNIEDSKRRWADLRREITELERSCRSKKEENLKVKFLFELRQLKLISEIQTIYPIEKSETSNEYCIRGLEMPNDLNTVDDDHISSALGYLAHLLVLLSKYLELPLRYPIAYASSKSLIRDPMLAGMSGGVAATLPLYRKGVDREKFEMAVILIQRNVQQVVHSVGLEYQASKSWLENLNSVFKNQVWPIMEGENGL